MELIRSRSIAKGSGLLFAALAFAATAADAPLQPQIVGEPWTIASSPDLGDLTEARQQAVDFAIWQAADGKWQIWSCIRGTREQGKARLFHRWEGASLTDTNWRAHGIAMQARPDLGETAGGLQAPHVVKIDGLYHMFYGDWERICVATSVEGKEFGRRLQPPQGGPEGPRHAAIFSEGTNTNTRDPMVIRIGDLWHCYYTAFPNQQGAVYCRTSKDTWRWGPSTMVAFGGEAGTTPFSSECPFVAEPEPGHYYLFRTQKYGSNAISRVYYSKNPKEFGVNDDGKYLVNSLSVAAPEIIHHGGKWYIASLLPSLKGIQIARMEWKKR